MPFSTPPIPGAPPTLLLPITSKIDTQPTAYKAHLTLGSPWVAVGTPAQLLRFTHLLPDQPMRLIKASHGVALAWPTDRPLGPVQAAVSFLTGRQPAVT